MSSLKKKAAPMPPKTIRDTFHLKGLNSPTFGIPKDTSQLIPNTKNPDSDSSSPASSTSEMKRLGESQENRSFMAINGPATQQDETSVKAPYASDGGYSAVASAYGDETSVKTPYAFDGGNSAVAGAYGDETSVKRFYGLDGCLLTSVSEIFTVYGTKLVKNDDLSLSRDNYANSSFDDVMNPKIKPKDLSDDSDEEEGDKFRPARGSGMFKSPLTASKESVRSMGSAGSGFTPVGTMHGGEHANANETDVKQLWVPSDDMSRRLDDFSERGSSNSWDTTDTKPSNPIQIIPQATRAWTPDSTASRGHMVVGPFSDEKRGVRFNKLPSGTTRDNIKAAVYEQETSFSYGAAGTNSFGDAASARGHEYDTPTSPTSSTPSPLGVTMRPYIRQQHQGIEQPGPPIREPPSGAQHPETKQRSRRSVDYDDEKIRPLWQKCVLLFGGLAILLAGIIAIVVVYKENTKARFGNVVDDPITHNECTVNDASLDLGDTFHIKCVTDLNHDQRVDMKGINVTYPDMTMRPLKGSQVNETNKWSWESSSIEATCANIGVYTLTFIGAGKPNTSSVTVSLKAPIVTATMEQFLMNDTGTSYFKTECKVVGDCTTYDVDIVGKRGNVIQENKLCVTNYSNTGGANTSCNVSVSESLMNTSSPLSCRPSKNGIPFIPTPFRYPECGFDTECKEKVNCTDTSIQKNLIENCTMDDDSRKCFSTGRKFFTYCKPDQNECFCKMNWCQQSRGFLTTLFMSDVPIVLLCNGTSDSFTKSPPTTTPNTTSTNGNPSP